MVHLHDQIADLRLEFLVLGFQLTLPVRWTIQQHVLAILVAPVLDQVVRQLMLACGLSHGHLAGLDLGDQLAFEIGFELSTNFSHCEYRTPRPTKRNGGREGLWKMPQLRKSNKVACGRLLLMISTSCLEKPSRKTLRLSHIYHS